MGMFAGFLDDDVVSHAVEPAGGSVKLGNHAATLSYGRDGTLHGARSIVLQEENSTTARVRSVASGLVYPGVGPEIAMLFRNGRIKVSTITGEEVLEAFFWMAKKEGIIIALESAHALAFAFKLAAKRPKTENILVNLSGRGDKDVDYVLETYDLPL